MVPGLAFIQTCFVPVCAGEMGLTWQEREMEQFPGKASCWSWAVGLCVSCSLSQPPLPMSQPPVGLLPAVQPVARVGSRWGWGAWAASSGFPQPTTCCQMGLSAEWHACGMAAGSQPPHDGLAPMNWDKIMFWKFGNPRWQGPDHQELSPKQKTLGPPGGTPDGCEGPGNLSSPSSSPTLGICSITAPAQTPASRPFAVLFIVQIPS